MYFNPVYDDNFGVNSGDQPPYVVVEEHFHTQEMKPNYYDLQEKDHFYTVMDGHHDNLREVEVLHKHERSHAEDLDEAQAPRKCEGLFRRGERQTVRNIKTSKAFGERYLQVTRGIKSQTAELNINVKTLTKNLLLRSVKMKQFSREEVERIHAYQRSKANFTTTQELFGVRKITTENSEMGPPKQIHVGGESDRIRLKCFQEYSSTRFVRSILKAEKMAFKNKIIMIKFLENIRQSCAFPQTLRKWKNK